MEKLSLRKQFSVIKLYFSGLPYKAIAGKAGISTGAVANVIADLKAGNYPEVGDISEQVEMLKELATEVRKSRLTVGEALTGIAIVNCLKELGLEPSEMQQCASLCKTLTPGDTETQAFVRAAMEYQEVLQRTGLNVADLEAKVKHLEETSSQLEPLAKKALDLKREIGELERKRGQLSNEVAALEKRQHTLAERVKEKEQREGDLSLRITSLEDKLQTDEEHLATARKDLKALASIGMNIDELTGFAGRLKGVAQQHDIAPKVLHNRLLTELEHLDKGLALETLIQTRQQELHKLEQTIARTQEKSAMLKSQNQQLQQELASLKAQIATERQSVSGELRKIVALAQDTVSELQQKLGKGVQESLDEIARLKTEALGLGKELGKLEATIKNNAWLEDILSLLKGEDKVEANQVRVIILTLLKSLVTWLERNRASITIFYTLSTTVNGLISELERWQPKENMSEGSKSFRAN
jgi:predicted  nucleic acid-binding Zn-ribbon protein